MQLLGRPDFSEIYVRSSSAIERECEESQRRAIVYFANSHTNKFFRILN